ncbi:MAG: phage virion morphogenesis protein [Micavibrio aeruginosavorus]|uniref:Phage virion morphogenesis protein n=1 Tax=Micavibrio aeruginosavorus TaxID=349221 RepID=A0A2W5MVB7_9BACT|nr:MAG: phage virion morphogenesis protein [Micavibrio aeruginosavorus]
MTAQLAITGDDILLKALRKVSSPATRREILDTLGSYGVSSTQQRFREKKTPEGASWKESRRASQGGQTLRDRNYLYRSLSYLASDKSVEWGTNLIYAAIHQFGGIIRPKNGGVLVFQGLNGFVFTKKVTIPARPYMGINNDDRSEMGELIKDYLGRAFQ